MKKITLIIITLVNLVLVGVTFWQQSLNDSFTNFHLKQIQTNTFKKVDSLTKMLESEKQIQINMWASLNNYGDPALRNEYTSALESSIEKFKKSSSEYETLNDDNFRKVKSDLTEYMETSVKISLLMKNKTPQNDSAVEQKIKMDFKSLDQSISKFINQALQSTETDMAAEIKVLKANNEEYSTFHYILYAVISLTTVVNLFLFIQNTGETKTQSTNQATTKNTKTETKKTIPKFDKQATSTQSKKEPEMKLKATESTTTQVKVKASDLIPFDEDENRTKLGKAEDF